MATSRRRLHSVAKPPPKPDVLDYAREVRPPEPTLLTEPPTSLFAPPPSAFRARSDAEAEADALEIERLHQNGDDPRF